MEQAPRFFCDFCGTEVKAGENQCPKCGRFFSAIRCPKCGFSGEAPVFKDGCPSCGYSAKKRKTRRRMTVKKSTPEAWLYLIATGLLILVLSILVFSLRK